MEREEAIEVLQKSTDNTIEMTIREWEDFDKKVAEAVDMAIEALNPVIADYRLEADRIYCAPQIAKDVEVVVRCKNCKWYEADIMGNPWGVCCHNGWVDGHSGHEVSEDGWCYRAEMMEVEHETD